MFNKLKTINLIRLFKLGRFENTALYLAVGIIFFLVNLLLSPVSLRADLSKGQAYTLSPATKKILDNLDDLVTIRFFVSSDLPTQLIPIKTEVVDLLNEYKKAGGNKITVKIINPKKDENALNDAKNLNIPQLQFSQLEKDKYAVTTAYFGIALNFSDKKEALPQVTEAQNLEYRLTSTIYKMTRKEIPKIGFIGENTNQISTQDPHYILKEIAGQQFNLNQIGSVKLTDKELDSSNKAIIVFDDNKKKYEADEIKTIKNYLKNGGKAVFFVDSIWITDNFTTMPAQHDLFPLIGDYGIRVNNDLILSTSSELVNFGNTTMQVLAAYPFWLKTNVFAETTSYFSNVNQLTFPWTSSITLEKKKNSKTKELIKSTPKSWEQKNSFTLNPQEIANPKSSDLKQFTLAAEAESGKSQIIVIPSSKFAMNQFLNGQSNNLEFILNVLNNLASGGALTGILSRAINFYPLPEMTDTQKDLFRYGNMLALPFIFALYGAVRLLKRK